MPDIEEGPTVKNSRGPATLTVYPASTVKGHGANDVGIYFPEAYIPSANLDLLVYFHGLPTPCGGSNSDSIRDIWRSSTFRLREMVNKSKKNVVLVAPTLKAGGLTLDMDAEPFLRAIVGYIAARVTRSPFTWHGSTTTGATKGEKVDPVIKIQTLILAAHSGGGTAMLKMAQELTASKFAKPRECWGLDSLYGPWSEWADWAAGGGKYFHFWTAEGGNDKASNGSNVTNLRALLAKASLKTSAGVGSGGTGSNARPDPDVTRAALAAPNITITFADKPSDTTKGFVPSGGRTFKSTTSNHCNMPSTYWADMMNSF